MLVLSRQRDETIMIGDDIEVTVVDIRGDKVRLGINAPKEISVHRKEVYDAIRRENRAAAQVKPEDLSGLGGKLGGAGTGGSASHGNGHGGTGGPQGPSSKPAGAPQRENPIPKSRHGMLLQPALVRESPVELGGKEKAREGRSLCGPQPGYLRADELMERGVDLDRVKIAGQKFDPMEPARGRIAINRFLPVRVVPAGGTAADIFRKGHEQCLQPNSPFLRLSV